MVFSVPSIPRSPDPFSSSPHFPWYAFRCRCVCWSPSCCSSHPSPESTPNRLGLPNCAPPEPSDSASMFFLHLSQLFPLAGFPFTFELCQEFLVHPCRAPATLAWLLAHWDGPFLESDTFQCQFYNSAYLHFVLLWWPKPTLIVTLIFLVHCSISN